MGALWRQIAALQSVSMTSTPDYAHGHHSSVLASHATRSTANSCAYFLDRLSPGMTVLDIGCGPGSISLDLARIVGPTGRVVGIDFSSDAISHARETLAAAPDSADLNVEFYAGDVYALAENLELSRVFDDANFDVVHAHQVLQHVPDPVELLRLMGSWCSNSGFIAARDADYSAMTWFPVVNSEESETGRGGMEDWRATYIDTAIDAGGDPDAGRKLKSWGLAAHLDVVSSTSSNWTYSTAEETSWWGNSQADRVRNSQFAVKARALGKTDEEIENIAQSWEKWGASADAWFCMMHGELIATP